LTPNGKKPERRRQPGGGENGFLSPAAGFAEGGVADRESVELVDARDASTAVFSSAAAPTRRRDDSPSDHVTEVQLDSVRPLLDAMCLVALNERTKATGLHWHPQSVLCSLLRRQGGSLSSYLNRDCGVLWHRHTELTGTKDRSWYAVPDDMDQSVIRRAEQICDQNDPGILPYCRSHAGDPTIGIVRGEAHPGHGFPAPRSHPAVASVDQQQIATFYTKLVARLNGESARNRGGHKKRKGALLEPKSKRKKNKGRTNPLAYRAPDVTAYARLHPVADAAFPFASDTLSDETDVSPDDDGDEWALDCAAHESSSRGVPPGADTEDVRHVELISRLRDRDWRAEVRVFCFVWFVCVCVFCFAAFLFWLSTYLSLPPLYFLVA
jgi:hypothetical protein